MSETPSSDRGLVVDPAGGDQEVVETSIPRVLALGRAMLDPYAIRILLATQEREETALSLSRRYGIPIVACYRRLRDLEELGLVSIVREEANVAGHPSRLYRARVRSARLFYEDGRFTVRLLLAPPTGDARAAADESGAAGDLRDPGAPVEPVAQGGEGALDAGEARREVGEVRDAHVADPEDLPL